MRVQVIDTFGLEADVLEKAVEAVHHQVQNELFERWSIWADVVVGPDPDAQATIRILEEPEDPQWDGLHFVTGGGTPSGWVSTGGERTLGDWTIVLSHEVLELLANPMASRLVRGLDPYSARLQVLYALEICDPVAGDSYPGLHGVLLSAFVTPHWFLDTDHGRPTMFPELPGDEQPAPLWFRDGGWLLFEETGSDEARFHPEDDPQDDASAARRRHAAGRGYRVTAPEDVSHHGLRS